MNFLVSIFRKIFGGGNPNQKFSQQPNKQALEQQEITRKVNMARAKKTQRQQAMQQHEMARKRNIEQNQRNMAQQAQRNRRQNRRRNMAQQAQRNRRRRF